MGSEFADKVKIALGVLLVGAVIATLGIYLGGAGTFGGQGLMLVLLVFFLIAGVALVFWPRFKAVKAGLPAEDERLKSVNHKAGYYAYIGVMWGCVALMSINSATEETIKARYFFYALIVLGGIVFMVSYLLLSRKGNVD